MSKREIHHAVVQPFKKGDVIRQYHHTDMFDDFVVTYAHDNGALDVKRKGVSYGLSARFSTLSPNQDSSIADGNIKRISKKIRDFVINILEHSLT
jgi:hypothetical protein